MFEKDVPLLLFITDKSFRAIFFILLTFFLLIGSACAEDSANTPAENSGVPVENSDTLHQWILVKVSNSGEETDASSLEGTLVRFGPYRRFLTVDMPCAGREILPIDFILDFQGNQQYEITQGDRLFVHCGDAEESQIAYISLLLSETHRYEIDGDQLLLIGEEIEITLERDDSFP